MTENTMTAPARLSGDIWDWERATSDIGSPSTRLPTSARKPFNSPAGSTEICCEVEGSRMSPAAGFPKSPDTRPTLTTTDGASMLAELCGNMLADAASEHLRSLDAYKHFIRKHKPTPGSHQAEAAYRNKVLGTEEDLKQATSEFQPGFEAGGGEFSGPKLGSASALSHACMAYLEGQERRAEASARWLQQQGSLGEVEREIVLIEASEQEVRWTLLAYQQHRG